MQNLVTNNKEITVITENGNIVNVNEEIKKLERFAKQGVTETDMFGQLKYLSSFVTKNTRLGNAIEKLEIILLNDGLDSQFIEQLGIISNLIESEVIEYEPVNENFVELYDKQQKDMGTSLLCYELDKRTGGIHPGKICTIVGGPGSMKTTYVTNICYEAVKKGKNICFLSLEETPLDLYSKLLSRVSLDLNRNLSVQDITQHKLSENQLQVLKEEIYNYLEEQDGTFTLLGESDLGDFSQLTIETKLKEVDERIKAKDKGNRKNHGLDIIVIDHLQMFKYVNSKIKDEYQLMNMYVSFFRKQCKNFLGQKKEITIILLSQCNREGIAYAQRKDGCYLMQHVAEASEIERASSYIISIYTDAGMQLSSQVKIGAVKLRGAALPTTTINTHSRGEYYCVGEVSDTKPYDYGMNDIIAENKESTSTNETDALIKEFF